MLPPFDRARVLVAGDVMLDRYWYGATSRISPEAPVPVVHVRDWEDRLGGAANVAANVLALGATPVLCGLTGDDEAADRLAALVAGFAMDARLTRLARCPTVTKLRIVSRRQQLMRLDFEDGFHDAGAAACLAQFSAALDGIHAVVLSDYGKGALADAQAFIARARDEDIPVFVDPKGDDFSSYAGATAITPNLSELEAVVGACHDLDELEARGTELCAARGLEALLVTRGEQVRSLLRPAKPAHHVPARAREVYDVTGAGDTVIAVLAAAVAAGSSLESATTWANLAAGIVVSRLGTAAASREDLVAATAADDTTPRGPVGESDLLAHLARARGRGETIVMTNGCFDILHAGHVRYLSAARALGDHLLVAVNDDASVQRLKGHGRPVNTLSRRMAVLAALQAVDWVVPFSEESPARLIESVSPDILVKGGDYRPEDVAGADHVRSMGGEVRVVAIEEDCSTTALIDSLNRAGWRSG